MKNIVIPLAKSVLVPFGLPEAGSGTDAAIQRKMFGSETTASIIFKCRVNEWMNAIMKIYKFLEESDLLIKGVSETVENEVKEQKREFLGMLTATLGDSSGFSINILYVVINHPCKDVFFFQK